MQQICQFTREVSKFTSASFTIFTPEMVNLIHYLTQCIEANKNKNVVKSRQIKLFVNASKMYRI
jgi:hypothetical protein